MERLTKNDLLALLEFIRESYDIRDLNTFAQGVISRLPKIVPSEIISYNEVNPKKRRVAFLSYPQGAYGPDENKIFEQHMHEHPLIKQYQKTRDYRAFKISDFLSQRQYHRLGLYNEFFRPLRVEHQMAFTLPARFPLIIGLALNRTWRNFSERDRLLLNLLGPHLIQAYRNAEAVTQMREKLALLNHTLGNLDQGIVVITRSGRVMLANTRATQWLAKYFGKSSPRGNRLPEELQRWVKYQQELLDKNDNVPPPRKPYVVERDGKRLTVRLVSDSEQSLLLLEEQLSAIQPAALESLGLSRREAEVLTWVAHGKTNVDIGTILGLSPRTVQKHLEHIFQKLGVETRTSAAVKAYEIASITRR